RRRPWTRSCAIAVCPRPRRYGTWRTSPDLPHLLVCGIIPPCAGGVHARVLIDDDALRGLTVDGDHLRAASRRTCRRYQAATVRLDDLSRLGKILLGVAIRIAHIDLSDKVDRRLGLSVHLLDHESPQRGACQHSQSDAAPEVSDHKPVPPVGEHDSPLSREGFLDV